MKDNFGEECVKGGLLSFQGKISLEKIDSFFSFDLIPPPLTSGFHAHTKLYFLNQQ